VIGDAAPDPITMAAPEFPEAELNEATGLLASLLRIDTSNPPGNERAAAELVAKQCREIGLEPELAGTHPDRPHRPLVLSCHLDVVPADPDRWTHDPFSGHSDGEYLWGRGSIDMKGFAVMGLAALTRLRRENFEPDRDIIFAAVCDEETGTRHGSRWLVDERPDLLGGDPEYVINEVGGFTVHRNGRRFYPVQVAEKGLSWMRLTVRGKPGHSSLPAASNAAVDLARAITAIGTKRLPWHPSPEATEFIEGFARPEGFLARTAASLFSHPAIGPGLLSLAVPDPSARAPIEALLRNTANPTCLRSGSSINVLPGQVSVDIDGRLAPGQSGADLVHELEAVVRPILGENGSFEILEESPSVSFSKNTPLYREIESTLQQADPEAYVVPSLVPGFTDSRNYARLGAQCYGFYPLQLPPDLDFASLFHGDDERIPIAGFHWGIRVLTDMLRRFLGSDS
jgi:acetylornithine deacetylase/succinyl-diaminopimelate desuccinylase-like protein